MATKVFINLPVSNLAKSMEFFQNLGFTLNPQFTDEKAACMVVSEAIYVMMLQEVYFKSFIHDTEIADAHKTTEVLVALDAASRDEVKQMVTKAESLGAKIYAQSQDHGWMYQHSFADLDGHKWEFAYMDMSQLPQNS